MFSFSLGRAVPLSINFIPPPPIHEEKRFLDAPFSFYLMQIIFYTFRFTIVSLDWRMMLLVERNTRQVLPWLLFPSFFWLFYVFYNWSWGVGLACIGNNAAP